MHREIINTPYQRAEGKIVVNQEMGLRGGFTISSLQMSLEIPSSNALANSMENTMYSKSVPSSTGKNPRGL